MNVEEEELARVIVDELMRRAEYIRSMPPGTGHVTIPLPPEAWCADCCTKEVSLDCLTITSIFVEYDRVQVPFVDALSFVVRHEYREIHSTNKQIENLQKENKRLREKIGTLRKRRSPEAVLWNSFMGRS